MHIHPHTHTRTQFLSLIYVSCIRCISLLGSGHFSQRSVLHTKKYGSWRSIHGTYFFIMCIIIYTARKCRLQHYKYQTSLIKIFTSCTRRDHKNWMWEIKNPQKIIYLPPRHVMLENTKFDNKGRVTICSQVHFHILVLFSLSFLLLVLKNCNMIFTYSVICDVFHIMFNSVFDCMNFLNPEI